MLELKERARPSVRQNKGRQRRSDAFFMDEVNIKSVDLRSELWERIQPRLLSAPVELSFQ